MPVKMTHCVSCGRLETFVGPLNKLHECEDCEAERLEDESEEECDETEDRDAKAYIRKAGFNPYQRYSFN